MSVTTDAVGQVVYLDRQQCVDFVPSSFEGDAYFDDGAKVITAASALLGSKDYDEFHKNLLGPLGGATLCLERHDEGPGWFVIVCVIFAGW
jgi:hypothetical protein